MNQHDRQTISAPTNTCCLVSQAPLPESKFEASKTTFVELEAAPAVSSANDSLASEHTSHVSSQVLSPPPRQSFLCTFQI